MSKGRVATKKRCEIEQRTDEGEKDELRWRNSLTINAPYKACSAFTRVTACTLALSPYIVTRYPKASATSLPP